MIYTEETWNMLFVSIALFLALFERSAEHVAPETGMETDLTFTKMVVEKNLPNAIKKCSRSTVILEKN